jgi:large subunit ribosomal protein L25
MAEASEIKASLRPRAGKGGARAIRREGLVPGVLYGDKHAPQSISLDRKDLTLAVGRGKFLSTVHDLSLDGAKCRVIPREVQLDPVKDLPLHVDFQRVGPGARIRVNVPVRFINEALSPGLKRGGVLNIVRHEVEVMAPADQIPDYFEFTLEGLEIGRSVHISATKMPDGVSPTIINRDFTVATIAGHKIEEETTSTPDAAAAVEGAVTPEAAEAAAAQAPADAKAGVGKEGQAKAPAGKEAPKPAAPKPAAGKK